MKTVEEKLPNAHLEKYQASKREREREMREGKMIGRRGWLLAGGNPLLPSWC